MKLIKTFVVATSLTMALTGCSGAGNFLAPEPVSMIGLSGADLTDVAKFDDMHVDDQLMFWSCRELHTYTTNESIDDAGNVEPLDAGTAKNELRDVGLYQLNLLLPDYPEIQVYIDGVTQELASGDGQDEGYQAFAKACKTYDVVQTNVEEHYIEPIVFQSNCWDGKHIKFVVQELIGEEWVTKYSHKGLRKPDHCSGDYPYGYTYSLTRSDADPDRTFRMVLTSTDGGTVAGKKKYVTAEQTVSPYTSGPLDFD